MELEFDFMNSIQRLFWLGMSLQVQCSPFIAHLNITQIWIYYNTVMLWLPQNYTKELMVIFLYSKTCPERPLKNRQNIGLGRQMVA